MTRWYRAGMNDLLLRSYRNTAIVAAHAAARIQLAHLGADLVVDTKSTDIDIVTQVDRLCEARIREIIERAHPGHTVLGEEEGQSGTSRYRWIVDPLDGTVNYAHGFPFFCVSIALEIDGGIELGVVYDAVRNELFVAQRGQGAFLNGAPIKVSTQTVTTRALLSTGFAYDAAGIAKNLDVFARVLPQVQSIRRPGAAALDLCYVACGRIDGFWELTLNPWDVAAGMLIVREAAGTVTGVTGEPYRVDQPALLASNGHLHGAILNVLGLASARA